MTGSVDNSGRTGTSAAATAVRIPHLGGLDGLRALAVVAVVLYHTELQWFVGGFLGVDVFFVISGYLITSLLLAEWRQTASTDLGAFWLRRARRLLPAAFAAIIATVTFTVAFLPDEVAGLRGDAAASFAYITNWYLIFSDESYFQAAARPSLLRHMWSLAVEEQFYILWPLLFAGAMRLLRARGAFLFSVAGAAASALLMAVLYRPDMDPSRVYYGTDTRAFALMIGAALSFVWVPGRLPQPRGARAAWLLDAAGSAALCALVVCFITLDDYDARLYRGGFVLVALITALLVATTVHPASRLGSTLLSWRPLQWIGQRSYGIYLWHWPIFALTRPQLDLPFDGEPLLLLRLPLTLLLAELSYRYVETPFRTGALGRAWHGLRASTGTRRRQLGLGWSLLAAALLLPAWSVTATVVSAQPPPPPSYLSVGGINTVDPSYGGSGYVTLAPTATPAVTWPATATPAPSPSPSSTSVPTSPAGTVDVPEDEILAPHPPARTPTVTATKTPTAAPTGTPAPTTVAPATATPVPAGRHRVLAIGDSVMIGAAVQLQESIADLAIDAAQGRQSWSAAGILRAHLEAGHIGEVVVIHLGNNYIFTPQQVDEIMQVLAKVQRVVFVNVKVPRPWEEATNASLAAAPGKYANAVVVDWRGASNAHPEYFWDDLMHLRPEGAAVYARLIAAAVGTPGGAASPTPSAR